MSLGDGSRKVLVQNVKYGPSHNIIVESLGSFTNEDDLEGLIVKNSTISDTDNYVRIKTCPSEQGKITIIDICFKDITMVDVKNPIIISKSISHGTNATKR